MSDETCNVPDLKLNHPSQNLRDPSNVIRRDLKHNFPETKTHGDIIVGHGKFTDNTITENQTQSVHTTKTVSSYGLLILTTILILVQLYVFTAFYKTILSVEGFFSFSLKQSWFMLAYISQSLKLFRSKYAAKITLVKGSCR